MDIPNHSTHSPDLKIISLDIETYGACHRNTNDELLPEQKVFNPYRSIHTDGVSPHDLILTAAITLPQFDPRPTPDTPWSATSLAQLVPADTMVFQMSVESHRSYLRKWLHHADTILGMNLQFDIQYLRHSPDFRHVLKSTQTLIDLSIVNYLHSELRPEKSLKSLGPILGTHTYQNTIKDGRFKNPLDPEIISYNAQDTHNTMVCIAELSKRIAKEQICDPTTTTNQLPLNCSSQTPTSQLPLEKQLTIFPSEISPVASKKFSSSQPSGVSPSGEQPLSSMSCPPLKSTQRNSPSASSPILHSKSLETLHENQTLETLAKTKTSKLSPYSIGHYSDTIWTCIRMTEAGIPLSIPHLTHLLSQLTRKCALAAKLASSKFNLILEGPGSAKSKQAFLTLLLNTIESESPHLNVLDNPLLTLTPKTKQISWSEDNRNLIASHLPQTHPLKAAIRVIKYHASSQKLISTYIYPLLFHKRNRPQDRSATLLPHTHSIGIAPPQWYIVPSLPKDTGSEGGTIQGRITCKNPSAQTFPPLIKSAMKSRWSNGTIIGFDLSQVELRVAALLSGDTKLIQSFTENLDLHTDRTLSVFGPDIESEPNFKSKWRQIGKTLNFADLFLASAPRMQRTVMEMCGELLPIPFFQNIVKTRYDQRPGLSTWQYELASLAETHNNICLPFIGQSRTFTNFQINHSLWQAKQILSSPFNKTHKSLLNEVVNFPIQTTAGNVLLQIQHYLHRNLPGFNTAGRRPLMFLQIYDSVYFDCPSPQIPRLVDLIKDAVSYVVSPSGYWGHLQHFFDREVPLLYEIEYSPS